jgi:2-keto-3-deoxy-6-phosphogluconate aldolase
MENENSPYCAPIDWGTSSFRLWLAPVLGPSGISAIRAILPAWHGIGAVGGISDMSFADYAKVAIATFGLGTRRRCGHGARQCPPYHRGL